MPRWVIREATVADVSLVWALTRAAFQEYAAFVDPPIRALLETEDDVAEFLTRGGAAIAEINATAVGCIRYELGEDESCRSLFLGRLAVLAAYRHQGIGRALVAWAEEKARAMGLDETRLGIYRTLTRNQQLYESVGYRIYEYRSRPGHHDDIALMRKRLT